jgi:hypothetical protein
MFPTDMCVTVIKFSGDKEFVFSGKHWNTRKSGGQLSKFFCFYLLVVCLTTLSVARTIWCRIIGLLMNNELRRTCQEATIAFFDVLSWCFPGEPKRTTNHFSECGRSISRDLNPGRPEYKAAVTHLKCLLSSISENFRFSCLIFKPTNSSITLDGYKVYCKGRTWIVYEISSSLNS